MKYKRYEIHTQPAPNRAPHPSRFKVHVDRVSLTKLLLKELIEYRGNLDVVLSRPCVYGVFSGPIGGFIPRERKCVGCLRCTVQYPDMVEVHPNPERLELGDSFFHPDLVDTVLYEAATGRVPVRGAGYRGAFGGEGWDGLWTDMSEIVRPTRDGIHGREFISTAVDLGEKPSWLELDAQGLPTGPMPRVQTLPVPFLFDRLPTAAVSEAGYSSLLHAAQTVESLVFLPLNWHRKLGSDRSSVPIVRPEEAAQFAAEPGAEAFVELDSWSVEAYATLRSGRPEALIFVRVPYGEDLDPLLEQGVRLFHLTADYHGRTPDGFVLDAIRTAHDRLVSLGIREQATLLGSGGIVAAEHVPKAIICGLDAVALDTPVLIAWQAQFIDEFRDPIQDQLRMPPLDPAWGSQRLQNLVASWRDQLLEILGAMGLREVRRLRGEIGRAMFQHELELEAFAGIEGIGGQK